MHVRMSEKMPGEHKWLYCLRVKRDSTGIARTLGPIYLALWSLSAGFVFRPVCSSKTLFSTSIAAS
jgi:hypothetical protein